MLEISTKEARGYFLLEFTRQLIKNNKNANIYLLNEILKQRFPEKPKEIQIITREQIQEKLQERKEFEQRKGKENLTEEFDIASNKQNTLQLIKDKKKVLKIPETKTSSHLNYLQQNISAEPILEKISPLLKDFNVKTIEIEGPNQKIAVIGTMGRKNTNITLANSDIQEILNYFSRKSKIPISEGVTKIISGNLSLTVIKSEQETHILIRKNPVSAVPKPFYT